MQGLFGGSRTTPGEMGCLGATIYGILFAAAMLGMLGLIIWQLDLKP